MMFRGVGFIITLALTIVLLVPHASGAQVPKAVPHIGVLGTDPESECGCGLRGQAFEGGQASRSARAAAYEVRVRDQPQDSEGARADYSAVLADPSRRDHPMIDRRMFMAMSAIAILATPLAAETHQPGKVYRIGFLGNSTPALEAHLVGAFGDGLRDLGYEEHRNIVIEYRWAEGNYERFPALVSELAALKVDVIVTAGTPATVAVKKATTSIPLVMVAVADPVGDGVVTSLAHPGGNITGVSSMALDLESKRLQLLREVIPHVATIAVFWNPLNASHTSALERVHGAARVLRMKVHVVAMRASEELMDAFASIVRERSDALLVLADRVFLHNRVRMMDLAARVGPS
jgi:ABC-type uncharacterized transport system substrate-binding protein